MKIIIMIKNAYRSDWSVSTCRSLYSDIHWIFQFNSHMKQWPENASETLEERWKLDKQIFFWSQALEKSAQKGLLSLKKG